MNGSTSQFGIRRLRRSVKVATARTATVGHHAIECISIRLLQPCSHLIGQQFSIQKTRRHKSLIQRPYSGFRPFGCSRLFTSRVPCEAEDIHTAPLRIIQIASPVLKPHDTLRRRPTQSNDRVRDYHLVCNRLHLASTLTLFICLNIHTLWREIELASGLLQLRPQAQPAGGGPRRRSNPTCRTDLLPYCLSFSQGLQHRPLTATLPSTTPPRASPVVQGNFDENSATA